MLDVISKQNEKMKINAITNPADSNPLLIINLNKFFILDNLQIKNLLSSTNNGNKSNLASQVNYEKKNSIVFKDNCKITDNIYFVNCKKSKTSENKIKKRSFSPDEDDYLLKIVNSVGDNNWQLVSKCMMQMNFNRNVRQCKDRYFHYLDPKIIKNTKWTEEQDELLLKKVEEIGKKWKQLEQFFPGRTEVSLRNRFILLKRKMEKNGEKSDKKNDIMSDAFSFLDDYYIQKKKVKISNENEKNIEKFDAKNDDMHALLYNDTDDENNIFEFDESFFI